MSVSSSVGTAASHDNFISVAQEKGHSQNVPIPSTRRTFYVFGGYGNKHPDNALKLMVRLKLNDYLPEKAFMSSLGEARVDLESSFNGDVSVENKTYRVDASMKLQLWDANFSRDPNKSFYAPKMGAVMCIDLTDPGIDWKRVRNHIQNIQQIRSSVDGEPPHILLVGTMHAESLPNGQESADPEQNYVVKEMFQDVAAEYDIPPKNILIVAAKTEATCQKLLDRLSEIGIESALRSRMNGPDTAAPKQKESGCCIS